MEALSGGGGSKYEALYENEHKVPGKKGVSDSNYTTHNSLSKLFAQSVACLPVLRENCPLLRESLAELI